MSTFTFRFVSFAKPEQDEPLRRALSSQGYDLQSNSCDEWLHAQDGTPALPTILYLAQAGYPREVLLSALDRPLAPSLGVCDSAVVPWDGELLGHCSEFIRWPCNEQELALRTRRLQALHRANQPVEFESVLLEEAMQWHMVGRSPLFADVIRAIKKLARGDAPVMIRGETGTGKELAARAIHYLSARRDRPFIPVNCGAIPDNLIENEFFGHQRGAYTDAKDTQPGIVALAKGGTLFLDEIESLSSKAQVALLRFLQDGGFRPLGARVEQQADLRVIAASNASLAELVEQGLFRADLWYRLEVLELLMPSLDERGGEDIEMLAMHFINQYRQRYEQPGKVLHPDTLRWLRCHRWAGNVRELEHLIHREFLLADGDLIYHVGDARKTERRVRNCDRRCPPSADLVLREAKAQVLADFEQHYLERLLEQTNGNISVAARLAGKERRAFGKLVKKYGIDRRRFHVEKQRPPA